MNSANMQNMLLEEEEASEEDVGSVLASSIEKGMRTVLSTVSRTSKLPTQGNEIALAVPSRGTPRMPLIASTPSTPNLSGRATPSSENFEQVGFFPAKTLILTPFFLLVFFLPSPVFLLAYHLAFFIRFFYPTPGRRQ